MVSGKSHTELSAPRERLAYSFVFRASRASSDRPDKNTANHFVVELSGVRFTPGREIRGNAQYFWSKVNALSLTHVRT